jgi:hypothetical protein
VKVFIGWTKSKEAIATHKYPESGLHPKEFIEWALTTQFSETDLILTNCPSLLFALAIRFTDSLEAFYVFDDGNVLQLLIDDEGYFIENRPENWGDEIHQLASGSYGDFKEFFKSGTRELI